jgi:phosphatidylserine/phosphatidylglycerophosphate/cardiolipin synthase-like enzyme
MKFLKTFLLLSIVTTSAIANVTAYFNHNPKAYYTDPYRRISRNGDNLEEVVLREIRSARKSIYLAVQELRLPLIAEALIAKKAEGVDVRVVIEHDYNFNVLSQRDSSSEGEYEASKLTELKAFVDVNRDGIIQKEELETRDAIYMLTQAKIPMMDDTSDSSRGSGLMHHKFMIVDGKTTIVSTANFTLSCIHGDILTSSSRGNANSMIVVESTNFSRIFTEEFSQLWGNGRRGNFGQNKTYRGPITTSVKGTKITVQFSPTSRRYQWEESVNGLMAAYLMKARQSVKAALFVFSDQKLADVLQDRHDAGAEIGVLIEPKFAYRDYSELLDLLGLEMLNQKCQLEPDNNPWKNPVTEAGMAILPRGDVLHHKFAVVDNKTVVMGSQNWSDAANYINDETLIVVQNAQISEQFTQEYNRLKRTATLGAPVWLKDSIRRQSANCAQLGLY